MKPALIDLEVYQGSTFNKSFQWLQGTTPVNLTGCSIKMQMALDYSSTRVNEFSTQNGSIIITNDILGKFDLKIAAAISSAWVFTKYIYDIEITFPNSDVYRVIQGRVLVDKEVTV